METRKNRQEVDNLVLTSNDNFEGLIVDIYVENSEEKIATVEFTYMERVSIERCSREAGITVEQWLLDALTEQLKNKI